MMSRLLIKNFKSIKNLELDCKKVNVFIGEPNTGKSNILEALGLLSCSYYSYYGPNIKDFIRMEDMTNIFFERDISESVKVVLNDKALELKQGDGFFTQFYKDSPILKFNYAGDAISLYSLPEELSAFRFYRFKAARVFPEKRFSFLKPPSGENLLAILHINKELRELVGEIFAKFGLKLVLKLFEGRLEPQKEIGGVAIAYPYDTTSDTLQRLVFHLCAIKTAKNSIIMLEEPEAHAFPYYTKYLAELIAVDETNQYFISTHNPYFLLTVIEKAPKEATAPFLTYFEDFQTKVKVLDHEKVLEMEADIFFNFDRMLEAFK